MLKLKTSDADFKQKLEERLAVKCEANIEVNQVVADIIADVRKRGDEAVFEYTSKFDRVDYNSDTVRVSQVDIEQAASKVKPEILKALKLSASRIKSYHQKQMPQNQQYSEDGILLGWRWNAVDKAGLYVPGGTAFYPSSVLMNAIPAKVAGVKHISMVVPTPGGDVNPLILAAAKIAGVTEIYKIGGAQAIAALAYGTGIIPKVDVIVGPGNAYVAAAKRQVYAYVGIDMIAGPSEILVIADESCNPRFVAADLLSQAEHDGDARSVLVAESEAVADAVIAHVQELLPALSRSEIARKSWEENGLVVIANDLDEAAEISNMIAPEHLELCVKNPEKLSEKITHAGAIFMGHFTPEAIGDYTAGPSHVLPTSGSARFASGLSVYDFLKRSSLIKCSEEGFAHLAAPTFQLANEEGLDAHALSISVRLEVGDSKWLV